MEEKEKKEELPNLEETIKELKEELQKALKEKEEYLAGWQRAKAEFLNYQQEEEKRKEKYILLANFNLISDLVNVLDSFELALQGINDEKVLKGIGFIKGQFESILKKYGLSIIEPKVGDDFNPNFHEALSRELCHRQDCRQSDEGKIAKVFSRGYALNQVLIKPAQVAVTFHQDSSLTQTESLESN